MTAAPASPLRKTLRDGVLLLVLAAIPALFAGWFHPKRPVGSWRQSGVLEIGLSEITRWRTPVLWVDARTMEAFQARHIPGAIPLNEGEWEQRLPAFLEAWQPNAKIVVYCDSEACNASQAVARRLQRELNLTDLHVLKGGWATWLKSNP